ncbi:MAG: LysR family transcriptional regulator [Rhodobacterales bacterium]|nr:MAG: LysR family transcriptional regulator [Rhodobacterales bacterium]
MPTRFTLRQLEYFVAVGRFGSISRAAESLNVSSPSISAAISQLEQELGLPLFVRKRSQGLSLTQAGRQLWEEAEQILERTNRFARLANDIAGKVRGPLSVGCLLTFAQIIVPTLRRSFEIAQPDAKIRQFELDQMEIFERLRRAEIDVALTYEMGIPSDFEFLRLLPLPALAMVPEDHVFANRDQVELHELVDHPMILLDLPYSVDYFLAFFSQKGLSPLVAERTRDMAVARSLVANGFGYSIVNTRPLNDLAPDGRALKFIPIATQSPPMHLGLIFVPGVEKSLIVKAFIEHCKHELNQESFPGLGSTKPPKH